MAKEKAPAPLVTSDADVASDNDMVAVVASERGYNSTEGRAIEPGETFYVSAAVAERGASWFDYADAGARKAAAKAKVAKATEVKTDDLA